AERRPHAGERGQLLPAVLRDGVVAPGAAGVRRLPTRLDQAVLPHAGEQRVEAALAGDELARGQGVGQLEAVLLALGEQREHAVLEHSLAEIGGDALLAHAPTITLRSKTCNTSLVRQVFDRRRARQAAATVERCTLSTSRSSGPPTTAPPTGARTPASWTTSSRTPPPACSCSTA